VIEEYIAAALSPAVVTSVTRLVEGENVFRVMVKDDQLSLAIGRAGQNARLAAKLVGAKIDIKPLSWNGEETEECDLPEEDEVEAYVDEAEAVAYVDEVEADE
jgi:N utilization substance protein A